MKRSTQESTPGRMHVRVGDVHKGANARWCQAQKSVWFEIRPTGLMDFPHRIDVKNIDFIRARSNNSPCSWRGASVSLPDVRNGMMLQGATYHISGEGCEHTNVFFLLHSSISRLCPSIWCATDRGCLTENLSKPDKIL